MANTLAIAFAPTMKDAYLDRHPNTVFVPFNEGNVDWNGIFNQLQGKGLEPVIELMTPDDVMNSFGSGFDKVFLGVDPAKLSESLTQSDLEAYYQMTLAFCQYFDSDTDHLIVLDQVLDCPDDVLTAKTASREKMTGLIRKIEERYRDLAGEALSFEDYEECSNPLEALLHGALVLEAIIDHGILYDSVHFRTYQKDGEPIGFEWELDPMYSSVSLPDCLTSEEYKRIIGLPDIYFQAEGTRFKPDIHWIKKNMANPDVSFFIVKDSALDWAEDMAENHECHVGALAKIFLRNHDVRLE